MTPKGVRLGSESVAKPSKTKLVESTSPRAAGPEDPDVPVDYPVKLPDGVAVLLEHPVQDPPSSSGEFVDQVLGEV